MIMVTVPLPCPVYLPCVPAEGISAGVSSLDCLFTRITATWPATLLTGMKLLKKQEDEFMVVAKKKKPQGKKGAPEPAPAAPKTAEPAKKKLNHSLEILKTFMTFGLEVPQTTAELAGTIEKVRFHGCICPTHSKNVVTGVDT